MLGSSKNIAIISLLLLVISLGGLLYLIQTINSLGTQLTEQIVVVENNNEVQQKHTELVALLKSTEADREELKTYILTEERTIDFLSEIEDISKKLGVTLETDALNVAKKDEKFDQLEVEFSVQGKESRVIEMMQVFENLPYHGHVAKISSTRSDNPTINNRELTGRVELVLSLLKS